MLAVPLPTQVASVTAAARAARTLVFAPAAAEPNPGSVASSSQQQQQQQQAAPVLSSPALTASLQQLTALNDALQVCARRVHVDVRGRVRCVHCVWEWRVHVDVRAPSM